MQITNKKNGKRLSNRTQEQLSAALLLQGKIEARAHEIYLTRGGEPGHELDDWLQAEREIMGWV